MNYVASTTFLSLFLASAPALAQQPLDPSGVWLRGDGNARVEIAPCGEKICATNLWIGDTSRGEEAGDRLVMSLKPEPDGNLAGSAYDEKRDRTYAIEVRKADDGLVTRGCVLGGILCREVRWNAVR